MNAKTAVHTTISRISHAIQVWYFYIVFFDIFINIIVGPKGERFTLIVFEFIKDIAAIFEPSFFALKTF